MLLRLLVFFSFLARASSGATLDIYAVDTEGGHATLLVSAHRSILIDTGYRGFDDRDAKRIVAIAKTAGLHQLDYVVITHYHRDHVGGADALSRLMHIGAFVDHGDLMEPSEQGREEYAIYLKAAPGVQRIHVSPGDAIPLRGAHVDVVSAGGKLIHSPLPGAGETSVGCSSVAHRPADRSENSQSIGVMVRYGKFRFVDLADLPWNQQTELVCPANLLGRADVYVTANHGLPFANSPMLLNALRPRVAIMNNGPHKGGDPTACQVLKDSPGLEDLWQLHKASGPCNSPDAQLANLDEHGQGAYLRVRARADGSFSVLNERTGQTKSYGAFR